jgi:hypothetical protein
MNVSDYIEYVNSIKEDPSYKNIARLILEVNNRTRNEEHSRVFMAGYHAGYEDAKKGLK